MDRDEIIEMGMKINTEVKENKVIGYELYEAKRDKRGIYHSEKITTYQSVNAYTEFLNKPENYEKWHNGYFRIQPIYTPITNDEDNKKTVLTGTIVETPAIAKLPHIETPDRNKLEWDMTFKLTPEQIKEIEKYKATLKPYNNTIIATTPDDTNEGICQCGKKIKLKTKTKTKVKKKTKRRGEFKVIP